MAIKFNEGTREFHLYNNNVSYIRHMKGNNKSKMRCIFSVRRGSILPHSGLLGEYEGVV